MAIAFCPNCNNAFENTRVGRGGVGGQCTVDVNNAPCNVQLCSDCAQKKCAICGRCLCNNHATTCKGQRVCSTHGFWAYLKLKPLKK